MASYVTNLTNLETVKKLLEATERQNILLREENQALRAWKDVGAGASKKKGGVMKEKTIKVSELQDWLEGCINDIGYAAPLLGYDASQVKAAKETYQHVISHIEHSCQQSADGIHRTLTKLFEKKIETSKG